MQRHLDEEINELKSKLIHMGALAEKMVELSVKGLVERTSNYEENVFSCEKDVNNLQIDISDMAVKIIALYHPVANDLRFLIMASKISDELERIGDQAVNILQNSRFLIKEPPVKRLMMLPMMADTVRSMLHDSLTSLINNDPTLSQRVLDTDDKVDIFKEKIFRELLTYMMSDPTTISRALALILISRNLERIGDHTTNIAEEVIYVVQAREVRHHYEKRDREGEAV